MIMIVQDVDHDDGGAVYGGDIGVRCPWWWKWWGLWCGDDDDDNDHDINGDDDDDDNNDSEGETLANCLEAKDSVSIFVLATKCNIQSYSQN